MENIILTIGDRVEATKTTKGGFYKYRYVATLIGWLPSGRVNVKDDSGKEHSPFSNNIKKLTTTPDQPPNQGEG